MGMNLIRERSMFFCPGPVRKLREVFPNGLAGSKYGLLGVTGPTTVVLHTKFPPTNDPCGHEGRKAAVLKYWPSRSETLPVPSTSPEKPGAKLARLLIVFPGLWIAEKGSPLWKTAIPAICQSFRN